MDGRRWNLKLGIAGTWQYVSACNLWRPDSYDFCSMLVGRPIGYPITAHGIVRSMGHAVDCPRGIS